MADPAAPAPADQAPEDKIPLLHVLGDLGSTLTPSEQVPSSQLGHVLGAVVKVLDHAGVEVADELWPEEPVQVARPETADAVHRQKTNERLDRLEGLLTKLVDGLSRDDSSSGGSES